MENFRIRTVIAVFGLLLITIWVMPNFANLEGKWWPSQRKLNYGLDIQGGLHLVMGVDVESVVAESSNRLARVLKTEFDKENAGVGEVTSTDPVAGEITLAVTGEEPRAKVVKLIEERYPSMLQVMNSDAAKVVVRYYDAYLVDYRDKVLEQSIETIRNRIDEFGVAEASISKQGTNRILIQLPGMADAERAKQLINTTAKLDFMLVEDEKMPADLMPLIDTAEKAGSYSLATMKYSEYVDRINKDLVGKIPEGTLVIFEKSENATNMETGKIPYLVKAQSELTGESLDDAFVSFDQYGVPEVALRFNALGAARFKDLTGNNVGRRMAVVLDKVVKTAPSIRTAIGDGNAVITMGTGRDREKLLEESKMIATSLRAGALPASLQQLEERRVGPSLGADSVKKAQMASLVAAIIVLVFMGFRYRAMGFIANLCTVINLTAVLALLTSLGATLTLPGIAGMALTIGFAVDANVLINERMREELAKGSSFLLAVKEGYAKAMSAILDSNITTAATAFVLLYFGTGPIKGFAVTLLLGILTTMFANVFINKWFVDLLMSKFGVKKLSV